VINPAPLFTNWVDLIILIDATVLLSQAFIVTKSGAG
jgi:hypothetical protein